MRAPCRLHIWDIIRFRSLQGRLSGSHIQLQIPGAAHGHDRAHGAVLYRKSAGGYLEHAGAGIHFNRVYPVFYLIGVYRRPLFGFPVRVSGGGFSCIWAGSGCLCPGSGCLCPGFLFLCLHSCSGILRSAGASPGQKHHGNHDCR